MIAKAVATIAGSQVVGAPSAGMRPDVVAIPMPANNNSQPATLA